MTSPGPSVRYAVSGALLALGAPAGWLVFRLARDGFSVANVQAELQEQAALYAYMLTGTAAAFVAFGAVLGALMERLLEANERLREQSVTDVLTGLRNPRYFRERLQEECLRADRERRPLALIAVDLDHFKRVNDRHGHAMGDRALRHAASVLEASARTSDIVCRVGGEEFAILCPSTLPEDAAVVAERMRRTLAEQPLVHGGTTLPLTASFGIAVRWPEGSPDTALKDADRALYAAKAAGRNRVHVTHLTTLTSKLALV